MDSQERSERKTSRLDELCENMPAAAEDFAFLLFFSVYGAYQGVRKMLYDIRGTPYRVDDSELLKRYTRK
jgi:hypothetical protein